MEIDKAISESQMQTVLEQYKLYVGTAEAVSQRRQTANSFFITLNAAILSILGFVQKQFELGLSAITVLSASGIIVSLLWYYLICSYRDLNTAKFKVIHNLEQQLPVQPFDEEWIELKDSSSAKRYLPFTALERLVPTLFLFLHIALIIAIASGQ